MCVCVCVCGCVCVGGGGSYYGVRSYARSSEGAETSKVYLHAYLKSELSCTTLHEREKRWESIRPLHRELFSAQLLM